MTADGVATPKPAATLVLLRDGADGLEVLMVARHEASGFAAGALVFPGGKVDPADGALAQRCPGIADPCGAEAAARVAAIRETWEECGILLARRAGAGSLLSAADVAALRAGHGAGLAALVEGAGLELAADRLVPFAHWITPVDRPKRFDTRFFVAPFDGDQETVFDGREAVDARWVRPADAIAAADTGRLKLVFATRMNLLKLSRWRSVAAALDAAQRQTIVTVTPQVVQTAAGLVFRIPAEADYGASEIPAEGIARA